MNFFPFYKKCQIINGNNNKIRKIINKNHIKILKTNLNKSKISKINHLSNFLKYKGLKVITNNNKLKQINIINKKMINIITILNKAMKNQRKVKKAINQ